MTEDTHVEQGLRLAIVVAGVSIAAVMQFLDSTIVNVALPIIGGNLGATFDEIGWVVTAYSLAAIAVIPLTGWLALRFGRKRYFIFSIVGFTLASALCGVASTFPESDLRARGARTFRRRSRGDFASNSGFVVPSCAASGSAGHLRADCGARTRPGSNPWRVAHRSVQTGR